MSDWDLIVGTCDWGSDPYDLGARAVAATIYRGRHSARAGLAGL